MRLVGFIDSNIQLLSNHAWTSHNSNLKSFIMNTLSSYHFVIVENNNKEPLSYSDFMAINGLCMPWEDYEMKRTDTSVVSKLAHVFRTHFSHKIRRNIHMIHMIACD